MTQPGYGHHGVTKPDGTTSDAWDSYTCGYCGHEVTGYVLASGIDRMSHRILWLQCPNCRRGSVRDGPSGVVPGVPFGPSIEGLPDEVLRAYEEARKCLSVQANTAAEGMCRKILMHVAVDKGAAEGKSFAFYLDYLGEQGYITPPMRDWVTLIKDHGNEAQHRIQTPDRQRSESTLLFTAQLLRTVYEMGHIAARFKPPSTTG